jgi:hypothetical protein
MLKSDYLHDLKGDDWFIDFALLENADWPLICRTLYDQILVIKNGSIDLNYFKLADRSVHYTDKSIHKTNTNVSAA